MKGMVPLRRVTRMAYGDSLASEARVDGDYPVVGSGGVSGCHNAHNFGAPGIVVGRKGSYGSVHWVPTGGFAIDTAYYIDKYLTSSNLRWLYYVLQAVDLRGSSQDVGVPGLSREAAYCVSVPAPPPAEEQRRIADFLDAETARIDHLDRRDQKLLGLLGERRKAVIDHEVDASSRSSTKLFWNLSVLRDGTHQPPPRVDLGVPLLTARNVSSGQLRLTELDTHVSEDDAKILEKSLRMMAGDVLLSVKGTIGACAVAPAGFPRSVLDRNVALLRPLPEYSSEWLAFVLRSTGLQDQMRISVTAAAQPGLPLGVIRELRVPDVPPNEQEGRVDRMSARCREIDQVVDRVKRKGSLLSERRQALITAAVTGQFDVSTASGRNVTDGVTA
ncbi:hypothetical protein AW27_019400 [Streptomyces sp. PCS3-D2]|uniref:restriction endonuclease subunit S n=1 Tax=Streptomyces sp. PCS3-D2 TaxID=1460244 RepID=UPI0012FEBF9D|nr:hypothetical protein [Streptomyces sp. PCS3-D2]WKV73497.1 hypothetical protein AW27_019400 [Streptomyces sp. PCS3-D2]